MCIRDRNYFHFNITKLKLSKAANSAVSTQFYVRIQKEENNGKRRKKISTEKEENKFLKDSRYTGKIVAQAWKQANLSEHLGGYKFE